MKKFPSFKQWKQIFKVLRKKEKITLLALCFSAFFSFFLLVGNFYINRTEAAPAFGGVFREAVVGQPRFINPIYGETNDIDRALIDLVFSGLMAYDGQGNIVNDLVSDWTVSEDGKRYDFVLMDNISWHDGFPLTADDVIFTVKTIQNSDYKSPMRANWIDVEAQKISDNSVRFLLKSPYNSFLENLTLKIIPKHIWEKIPPENFILSSYNLQPIGSGPFYFKDISQAEGGLIKQINLESNRKYHNQPSFIAAISFEFFEKEKDLVKAASLGQIDGFSIADVNGGKPEINQGRRADSFTVLNLTAPRYLAVFFNNQKISLLSDNNIRKALVLSVNKDELISEISERTNVPLSIVDSPIIPEFFGYRQPSVKYNFDAEAAKILFDKAGFAEGEEGYRTKTISKTPAFQFKSYLRVGSKGAEVVELQGCLARLDDSLKNLLAGETSGVYGKMTESAATEFQKKYLSEANPTGETGPATRQKLNKLCSGPSQNSKPLKLTLFTVNQPPLTEAAELLRQYWESVGVSVEIKALSLTDLKPIIKNRTYDALLYGHTLGMKPDLYPFWHSSQRVDPGLNLAFYENADVDRLLKEARETMDPDEKTRKLEDAQDIIAAGVPALFLYNPSYVYWISGKARGVGTEKIVDPAKRFSNITNWYVKTKRVWR